MAILFNKIKTAIGMDDVLDFGAWRGHTVEEVINLKPEYIKWVMNNTDKVFYESVHEALELAKYTQKGYNRSFRGGYDSNTKDYEFPKKKKSYFYDGGLRGEQAHFEAETQSGFDDWFDDIPF